MGKRKKIIEGVYCRGEHFNHAGTHLLIELWQAKNIDSVRAIKKIFSKAIKDCGATLLRQDYHRFTPFKGISGIAIIKESHISIHSWPELNYAAVDIFVCGSVDPYRALPAIKEGFKPKKIQIIELKRGILEKS